MRISPIRSSQKPSSRSTRKHRPRLPRIIKTKAKKMTHALLFLLINLNRLAIGIYNVAISLKAHGVDSGFVLSLLRLG